MVNRCPWHTKTFGIRSACGDGPESDPNDDIAASAKLPFWMLCFGMPEAIKPPSLRCRISPALPESINHA